MRHTHSALASVPNRSWTRTSGTKRACWAASTKLWTRATCTAQSAPVASTRQGICITLSQSTSSERSVRLCDFKPTPSVLAAGSVVKESFRFMKTSGDKRFIIPIHVMRSFLMSWCSSRRGLVVKSSLGTIPWICWRSFFCFVVYKGAFRFETLTFFKAYHQQAACETVPIQGTAAQTSDTPRMHWTLWLQSGRAFKTGSAWMTKCTASEMSR